MTHSTAGQGGYCQACRRRTWLVWFLLSAALLVSSAAVLVLAIASL